MMRPKKIQKPNAAKLLKAGKAMENAFRAYEKAAAGLRNAQKDFARIAYDAGNHSQRKFYFAMKDAASAWHYGHGGRVGFSNDTIESFFREFSGSTRGQ